MVRPRVVHAATLLVALLLVGPVLAACGAEDEPAGAADASARSLEAPQFARAMSREDTVLVDVRTPVEFRHGHVEGARNLNIHADDFERRIEQLDPGTVYAVYCRDGQRSTRAARIMAEHGVTRVFQLEGGLEAWMAYGGGLARG